MNEKCPDDASELLEQVTLFIPQEQFEAGVVRARRFGMSLTERIRRATALFCELDGPLSEKSEREIIIRDLDSGTGQIIRLPRII